MLYFIPFYNSLFDKKLFKGKKVDKSHVLVFGSILAHSYGEKGCIASNITIGKETQLGKQTVANCIHDMAKSGWVRVDMEKGKRMLIVPLLGIATPYLGEYGGLLPQVRGVTSGSNIDNNIDNKEKDTAEKDSADIAPVETTKKKKSKSKKPDYSDETPFTLEQYIESMRASPLKHIKILGEYADEIHPDKTTKGQWREFTNRNIQSAHKLAAYSFEKIGKALDKLRKDIHTPNNPKGFITKWDLGTVLKYIE